MLTEYKDNEAYERDKAEMIRLAEKFSCFKPFLDKRDVIAELLRQSKWVGADSEGVRPLPVVKDGNGKLVKDYRFKDWFQKLHEELDEVIQAILANDNVSTAEELQDLITVATSMQERLGFDEEARNRLAMQVNEKNRKRGYLEKNHVKDN